MRVSHPFRLTLVAMLLMVGCVTVSAQSHEGVTQADWNWVEKYFPPAFDTFLPIQLEGNATIAFRMHHDYYNIAREYSVVFYAKQVLVRIADGESIYRQLLASHLANRSEPFEEILKRIKIKEWKLSPESCPGASQKQNDLLQMKFQPQRGDMIFLHPVVHEFRIRSNSGSLSVELYDPDHPFVKWFDATRAVLDNCIEKLDKSQ